MTDEKKSPVKEGAFDVPASSACSPPAQVQPSSGGC